MSSGRLAQLRKMIKDQKDKKEGGGKKSGDVYPFWNMNFDEKATVRILPDKNKDNPYIFYVEKLEHKISINGKDKTIPCLSMYGEECPICELSKAYYKQEGKESKNGKYYYRNKTSMMKGVIIKDPLPADDETGETAVGKVKTLQFGYQLMQRLISDLNSEDFDDDSEPWSLTNGNNFFIVKSKQGIYGNYAIASAFSRKETPVADDVELVDLSTLIPANPGYENVKRLLDLHLNGGAETPEEDDDTPPAKSSGKRTVRESLEDDDDETPAPPRKTTPAPVVDEDDEDEDDTPPAPPRKTKPAPVVDEDDEDETPAPPRKTKPAPVVDEDDEDEDDADLRELLQRVKRNK